MEANKAYGPPLKLNAGIGKIIYQNRQGHLFKRSFACV